jgi:hypothetical protein
MSLTKNPIYIKEPDSLQCGQAVLAMLTDSTVDDIINIVGTERETKLKDMFMALKMKNIKFCEKRIQVQSKEELPEICILSLETPRCWHWSLYFKGVFLDPEHGILDDFPNSNRKYYWEIIE